MTKEEALQLCGDPIARRGIRALYRLALVYTSQEVRDIQVRIVQLGLSGMRAVHHLEHCLKEAQ